MACLKGNVQPPICAPWPPAWPSSSSPTPTTSCFLFFTTFSPQSHRIVRITYTFHSATSLRHLAPTPNNTLLPHTHPPPQHRRLPPPTIGSAHAEHSQTTIACAPGPSSQATPARSFLRPQHRLQATSAGPRPHPMLHPPTSTASFGESSRPRLAFSLTDGCLVWTGLLVSERRLPLNYPLGCNFISFH
jgi:hypothetical protein